MWVYNPNRGGLKIPPAVQQQTQDRLRKHAEKIIPKTASGLQVRFRGHFCYIDLLQPGDTVPTHLCRLRYKGLGGWSLAHYTYSHENYEESFFVTGSLTGTPEEALQTSALFL
jgi:hypothetical protein